MARVVLILPTGSYRVADFVSATEQLSIDFVVASDEEAVLAQAAGLPFIHIDCARPQQAARRIVEFSDSHPIDAIVPADDQGVVVAALASKELGLASHSPAAAQATRNKAMMRRALARAEVPQPGFAIFSRPEEAEELAVSMGGPVVMKPLSLSGSQGVIRVDNPAEALDTARRIRRILAVEGHNPSDPLLMERFIPGHEIAVEGLVRAGTTTILGLMDKPDPLNGPYFEETILVTPSRLHPEMQDEVEAVVGRAVAALGLSDGPVHAEVRIDGTTVHVIEIAARSIGGHCGRIFQFGMLGTSLEALILRNALGMPIRGLNRQAKAAGVMMLPIPRTGVLEAVSGVGAALDTDGITELEIAIPIGEQVRTLPEGNRYLGFMFAEAGTPEEAVTSLRTAHRLLHFQITASDGTPGP